MSQIVATCTYLKDFIGLGFNQSGTYHANVITSEGLDYPAIFFELAEYNSVKNLCHNVKKQAGTEPQSGWIVPNPNPCNLIAPRILMSGQDIPFIF